MTERTMRIGQYILIAIIPALFAGCAANKPFIEGKQLIAEGKLDAGLTSLEKAAREEPENLEIRTVLTREREAVADRLLLEADNARSSGDFEAAERVYRRVLEINQHNERAWAGLAALDMERRHMALLKHAEELLKSDDYTGAEAELRRVLQDSPAHREAQQLMRQISEKEIRAGEIEQPILKTGFKQPITLEFRDAPLKSVFEIMGRTAGINFVFDKDVKQDTKTTVFLRDTHVEDVLKLLLMTNQLTYKALNENTVLIYPNTPAKQKEYQELMVRSFYLANADAKQMAAMIKSLIKTKDIHIDENLNMFVMKDTPDAIRLADRLVALNDLADPEVVLEVEVLEIRRDRLLNLGIQYPDKINVNWVTAGAAVGAGIPAGFEISSAGVNRSGSNLDSLTGFITSPAMIINLKKTQNIVNVLANPRIRVKNREKAKFLIGDKVPVVTTTATANVGIASSVSYLDVGLKLDVESTVSLRDEVSMKVGLEVSNIVKEVQIANGGLAYQIGTRTATTVLALSNGETQVLAGLISDDERTVLSKIPGLGDLPWVGRLFTNRTFSRNKTEIALLITPRIVRNIARPAKMDSEFHFGTENAAGVRPVKISKVAPRSLAISSSPTGSAGGVRADVPPPLFDESRATPAAPAQAAASVLSLVAPEHVSPDKEFAVSVNLAGPDTLPASELELTYDASLLEAMDGGEKSGTRLLKLGKGGGVVDLRFKILAQKPGTTQVGIKSVTLQGESENSPSQITLPPAANIEIR